MEKADAPAAADAREDVPVADAAHSPEQKKNIRYDKRKVKVERRGNRWETEIPCFMPSVHLFCSIL